MKSAADLSRSDTLSLQSSIVANPKQVSCKMADEVVILSLQNGEYYGLNAVAASVWDLIQEQKTVSEVCDDLLDEYAGVKREDCETEVLRTLGEMAELGLVEIR